MQSNGSGNQHRFSAALTLACVAAVASGLGLYYLAAPSRAPAQVVVQPGALVPISPSVPTVSSAQPASNLRSPDLPTIPVAEARPATAHSAPLVVGSPNTFPSSTPRVASPPVAVGGAVPSAARANAQQCQGITQAGQQCRRKTTDVSGLCPQHRQVNTAPPGGSYQSPSYPSGAVYPTQPVAVPAAPALMPGIVGENTAAPTVTSGQPEAFASGSAPGWPPPVPTTGSDSQNAAGNAFAVQCSGMTASGNRCRRMTTDASGYCYQHRAH